MTMDDLSRYSGEDHALWRVRLRLGNWASQHSNVTPLDGTDRNSPTFGDLRAVLGALAASLTPNSDRKEKGE